MRGKQTSVLIFLALGLFAFIWFFERHIPDSQQRADHSTRLIPALNPNVVSAVELTISNLALRAVRGNGGWLLTSPVNYPAQALPVENLISAAAELTSQQRIAAAELSRQPKGLAEYGLQPPRAVLRLTQPTNRVELFLGDITPLGDRIYLQVAGGADVFTAGSNFISRLPRAPEDWRDPALVQLDGLAFNRLTIRAGTRSFTVERETNSQPWRLTKPLSARADSARIEALLQQLRKWRATTFITDNPRADLDALGLQPPDTELALGNGTNDTLVVEFGRSPTNDNSAVYARRLAQTNIVLVPRAPLEQLQLPYTEFRERRLAHFEPGQVEQIDIRAEDNFALRRETNGQWRVVEPLNFPADGPVVTNLLVTLGSLDVTEFVKDVVTDFSAYGLARPGRTYTLRGAATAPSNTPLAAIAIGTNLGSQVYARRLDEESVYTVPAGPVQRLPQALFELRDRRLWEFNPSNVVAVTINQGGRTRKLVRDTSREWINAPDSSGEVNSLAVESLLISLGNFQALIWSAHGAAQKPRHGFRSPGHEVTIDVAAGERVQKFTLELGGVSPSGRPYGSVLIEGEPVIFEFAPAIYEFMLIHLAVPGGGANAAPANPGR